MYEELTRLVPLLDKAGQTQRTLLDGQQLKVSYEIDVAALDG